MNDSGDKFQAYDEWNVRGKARYAFVHIVEWLQVGELHHHKEGLLERIGDCCSSREDLVEGLLR